LSKKPLRDKLAISGGNLNLTLLVENNEKIESFYRLNLYTWLALETVTAVDATTAMKILGSAEGKEINLIIARAQIGKEQTALELVNFLKSKNLEIPVIVIGPGKEVPGTFAHMKNSLQLKTMIQGSAKALGITAQAMMNKPVPDYFPIPLPFFSFLKRSVCTVYAQDKSVLFEKMKDFSKDEIKSLESSGVKTLFVNKLDRLEFVNNLTTELMATLDEKELSADEQMSAGDATLNLASKKLVSMGITEETVGLAHKAMDVMKKNAKQNPKLSQLLDRLLANKTSYLFTHTQLLSYIGLHIVKNIDWGNNEQEEKICFIAFFHDIALEKDEHGKIKSSLELKKADFSEIDKSLVDKHAQISAELVSKFPHAPMGADQIIRQHHGTLNGVGFSEHFGNNVSPMSIVFIVAEEFTRIVLKYSESEMNRTQMIRELKDAFPKARFQKVIDLLNTITF
jgi:response regulator RpfG family c-di-GMP phosphodiesterase